jgi:transcriptional regulator with XRE-family HTH domain
MLPQAHVSHYSAALQSGQMTNRKRNSRMFDHKKFQKWLSAYRQENNLTLRQVSEQTGIAISRLSEIGHGRIKNPSLSYLTAFARALGYTYLSDFIAEIERSCFLSTRVARNRAQLTPSPSAKL